MSFRFCGRTVMVAAKKGIWRNRYRYKHTELVVCIAKKTGRWKWPRRL